MLRELHISNLAVIEDVTVELGEGLNCFTGQTGAGKSLILGAFEILLGLRSGGASDMIRPGAEEARITGVFELNDGWVARQVGSILDTTLDPGEQVLITRKFYVSGRSSVSVNGQPATGSMVRSIGELLVDIHGQHDHQFLLKPSNQLLILDGFARTLEVRERFAEIYARSRELVRRRSDLDASRALRRQQLELYEFQAQEIDTAAPIPGEFAELKARDALLSNLEKIKRDAGHVYHALYESEGAVVERLQAATHVLATLTELDSGLTEVSDAVRGATLALQEAAFNLSRHVDRLDLNPGEAAEVGERLNTLNRLVAKYGKVGVKALVGGNGAAGMVDPLADVLAYREQIGQQIESLRTQDEDLAQIDGQIDSLASEMETLGAELTSARKAAAERLQPLVEAQLKDLGMSEAELGVEFTPSTGEDGKPGGASGMESIEFLIRTNPGQPARPLRKIASGGELSRIMLALKSVLAQSDRISVLVFDEIDANIGGRMGTIIGEKLRALARGVASADVKPTRQRKGARATGRSVAVNDEGSSHQVVCITHLPQIAAFADRHLRIAKAVEGKGKDKQTRTTVTRLDGDARVTELAEMLAGKDVTDTTRRQIREMLDAAV